MSLEAKETLADDAYCDEGGGRIIYLHLHDDVIGFVQILILILWFVYNWQLLRITFNAHNKYVIQLFIA